MTRIDLRSDTVTHPSPEMRQAMYDAELGDDVFGDDPTVIRLQEKAAEMLGKEAGLFVSSGTQSNLVAVLSQAQRGDEIIVGDQCHILNSEAGGFAVLGSVYPQSIPTQPDGTLDVDDIIGAVKPDDVHRARTVLLCIENTHNGTSGMPITPEATKEMADAGKSKGLKVHLDGARIFNAAVALECPPDALTADVDSVGFCLSKGAVLPRGQRPVRRRGLHQGGRPLEEDAGRGHAAGWRARGSRHRGAGHDDRPHGRGPRQCQALGLRPSR